MNKILLLSIGIVSVYCIYEAVLVHAYAKPLRFDKRLYENKDDFSFATKFRNFLFTNNFCNKESNQTIFIGGLNEGQLAQEYYFYCPGLSLVGVEIQTDAFERLKVLFKDKSNVYLYNIGIGDVVETVYVRGAGEGAFLNNEDTKIQRFTSAEISKNAIQVLPLAMIHPEVNFLYTVIDTEGYEPIVIAGMGLQRAQYRKKFPLFQFEIGGTWALGDDRHPKGSMTLDETFTWLLNRGYRLFLIGKHGLLPIDYGFYASVPKENEGYGEFLGGNVMAACYEFMDPKVVQFVESLIVR